MRQPSAPLNPTIHGAPARATWPLLMCSALLFAGCASAPSRPPPPASSGAAGGATAVGADSSLQQCPQPVGTVRLQDGMQRTDTTASQTASNANIESMRLLLRDFGDMFGKKKDEGPDTTGTLEALRLLIQQSNCMVIVERGLAEGAATDEKRRTRTGNEARADANMGEGQEVAADFVLRSTVLSLEQNKSSGFNMGSLLPGVLAGAVSTGSKISEAKVQLVLFDVRAKTQLAVSQGLGSAENTKLAVNVLGALGGGSGRGGYSSQESTSAKEVVMQAFADAYNKMVPAVRDYKSQQVKGGLGAGGTLGVQGARNDPGATAQK